MEKNRAKVNEKTIEWERVDWSVGHVCTTWSSFLGCINHFKTKNKEGYRTRRIGRTDTCGSFATFREAEMYLIGRYMDELEKMAANMGMKVVDK